jgi:hypothetical protein
MLRLLIIRWFLNRVVRKHEQVAALGAVTSKRKYIDAAADLEGVARVMSNSPRKLWRTMRELEKEIKNMENS